MTMDIVGGDPTRWAVGSRLLSSGSRGLQGMPQASGTGTFLLVFVLPRYFWDYIVPFILVWEAYADEKAFFYVVKLDMSFESLTMPFFHAKSVIFQQLKGAT